MRWILSCHRRVYKEHSVLMDAEHCYQPVQTQRCTAMLTALIASIGDGSNVGPQLEQYWSIVEVGNGIVLLRVYMAISLHIGNSYGESCQPCSSPSIQPNHWPFLPSLNTLTYLFAIHWMTSSSQQIFYRHCTFHPEPQAAWLSGLVSWLGCCSSDTLCAHQLCAGVNRLWHRLHLLLILNTGTRRVYRRQK